MSIDNLYRQVIMDHYKNPRNKGLKGYPSVHLRNPSCGDDITIEALIDHHTICEINHEGVGCSICCSSASVMSEVLKGKTIEEAKSIIHAYYQMIKGEEFDEDLVDEAVVYQGVSQFPARMKCATIAWQALEELVGEKKREQ